MMPKAEVALKPSVETLDERLNAAAEAVRLLQASVNSMPTPAIVMAAVNALQNLHDEKFVSIQTQFRERDTRAEQTAKDNKTSIDAALQAAKEAVSEQNKSNTLAIDKSEAAFTKQIDQIGTLIATTKEAIDGQINDMKTRLTTIESHGSGVKDGFGYIVGGVGLLVGVLSVVGFVLSKG